MIKPKRVVITGAHSPLGRATLEALLKHTNCQIVALVTPWCSNSAVIQTKDRVILLEQDLQLPLSQTVASEISRADILLHYAWFRDADVHMASTENKLIIERILEYLPSSSQFVLISSVGASAITTSAYGKAKWEIAQVIKGKGGLVLVCGLVVSEPPFGPYAILIRWIQRLWIRPRFFAPPVPVYLTPLMRVTAAVVPLTTRSVPSGVYRVFDIPPTNLNLVLANFEGKLKFLRPLLPIPTWLLLSIANTMKGLNLLSTNFLDKLLSDIGQYSKSLVK